MFWVSWNYSTCYPWRPPPTPHTHTGYGKRPYFSCFFTITKFFNFEGEQQCKEGTERGNNDLFWFLLPLGRRCCYCPISEAHCELFPAGRGGAKKCGNQLIQKLTKVRKLLWEDLNYNMVLWNGRGPKKEGKVWPFAIPIVLFGGLKKGPFPKTDL